MKAYYYLIILTMLLVSCESSNNHALDLPVGPEPTMMYLEVQGEQYQVDLSSAISSVVTGTSPFYHTITADKWLDRQSLQTVAATPDEIAVSTLADELKIATKGAGKVCAVAAKKETAALLAGHNVDRLAWNDDKRRNQDATSLTVKALQLVVEERLGQDSVPDLLFLQYEKEDYQSALQKLVVEIQRMVGKQHALFVLTSTGYRDLNTDEYAKYHIPTGVYYTNRTANLLNMYLGALWGQGKYVEGSYRNQLYLNHQLLEQKRIALSDATQKAKEFLLQMAGVKRVNIHLYEAHMGDLVVELAPGWQMQNDDTHEQLKTKQPLACFPIIFYGADIPAQKVQAPVSIERIAPTISKAIRIRAPNACMATPLF